MNSLQTLRIQKSRRVAKNHPTISCNRRYRPPSSIGQRLCAVPHRLAAFEQLRNQRMPFELLQDALRIKPGIGIVQASYESKRNNIVLTAIDPSAAVLARGQRPSHRVNHFARSNAPRGNFPKLLHSLAVGLGITIFCKIKFIDELLGQRSARAFSENRDLRL